MAQGKNGTSPFVVLIGSFVVVWNLIAKKLGIDSNSLEIIVSTTLIWTLFSFIYIIIAIRIFGLQSQRSIPISLVGRIVVVLGAFYALFISYKTAIGLAPDRKVAQLVLCQLPFIVALFYLIRVSSKKVSWWKYSKKDGGKDSRYKDNEYFTEFVHPENRRILAQNALPVLIIGTLAMGIIVYVKDFSPNQSNSIEITQSKAIHKGSTKNELHEKSKPSNPKIEKAITNESEQGEKEILITQTESDLKAQEKLLNELDTTDIKRSEKRVLRNEYQANIDALNQRLDSLKSQTM